MVSKLSSLWSRMVLVLESQFHSSRCSFPKPCHDPKMISLRSMETTSRYLHPQIFVPCLSTRRPVCVPKYFFNRFLETLTSSARSKISKCLYPFRSRWRGTTWLQVIFLTIDVSIHHAIDIGRKFNPMILWRITLAEYNLVPLAWNDCPKNTRRTVQLWNH